MKYEYLDDAFNAFVEEQTQDTYLDVLMNMFLLAAENRGILIPVREVNNQLEYKLIPSNEGYFYAACTNELELEKLNAPSSIVVELEKLIKLAAYDKKVNGICFNPGHETPCFIPKEYMRKILNDINGEE